MLGTYLTDLEQLMEAHRWDLALRDAVDLPHIAVALADPRMRSSRERAKAWSEEWISGGMEDTSDEDRARIMQSLSARLDQVSESRPDGVPKDALRRLRLRRHARTRPRGFGFERSNVLDPTASDTVSLSTAVVDGIRRWYAHAGCHDPITQANLARLAVLR